ncbi:MAG: zinc-binding dehydrogenase [Armatimonadetes bacterium]|nr:zinc-binding dehydrogenase [Armatimonadota bacterium]
MSGKLEQYRAGVIETPATNLAWNLYGEGLENVGRDGRPLAEAVPEIGPDDLLARVDACGLCFSDIKVIKQGGAHPRLFNRDLANDPTVLGHEVAMTVVQVGENLQGQYKVGDRFVIQADIYYHGVNLAFGYMIKGGLQQFVRLGDEVLRGDDGCYLIPVKADMGYAEAALAEPWACVVRAYRDTRRRALKQGGKAWVVWLPEASAANVALGGMDTPTYPGTVVVSNCPEQLLSALRNLTSIGGIRLVEAPGTDYDAVAAANAPDGFDEIFVVGNDVEAIEQLAGHLGKDAVMTILADRPLARPASIDVGKVHYAAQQYVASSPGRPLGGYAHPRPLKLLKDGTCWICGAGGPMGQMHVQLAVEASDGPRLIVATDIDNERLALLPERFGAAAAKRGCRLVTLNPKDLGEGFEAELSKLAPDGFDDVVCLVPVPAVIGQCSRFLGKRGVLNIFAGVPIGTMADLDLNAVIEKGVRYFGSSGSDIADLKKTLSMAEQGELSPNMAVAAIGGIEAVKDGLQAVMEARFPGKTVIYPQLTGLPLTALSDLGDVLPEVAAKLAPGHVWTREAEVALLENFLGDARS